MLTLALLLAAPAQAETPAAPAGHELVWSDEFDRPGLPDPARWHYDTHRNAQGWHNDELQYYSANRPENARIEDGKLIIEARHEPADKAKFKDSGGQAYTSARLLSVGEGWRYGIVEARAKLPCGRGSWPAIWMLPVAADTAWPLQGEIDIMEHVGFDPGVVHGTVHTGAYNHVAGTQKGKQVAVPDACTAFHVYRLRWTAETIEISVDGKPYFRFDNDKAGTPETWPFDKPFRLILNLALGGGWGGQKGVDDSAFPQRMEIDYVRVYRPRR